MNNKILVFLFFTLISALKMSQNHFYRSQIQIKFNKCHSCIQLSLFSVQLISINYHLVRSTMHHHVILIASFLIILGSAVNRRSFSADIQTNTFRYVGWGSPTTLSLTFKTSKADTSYDYAFSFQDIQLQRKSGYYLFLMSVLSQTTSKLVLDFIQAVQSQTQTIRYILIESSFSYLTTAHMRKPISTLYQLDSGSTFNVVQNLPKTMSLSSVVFSFLNGLRMALSTSDKVSVYAKTTMLTTTSVNVQISNSLNNYCKMTDLTVDVLVYDLDKFKSAYNNEAFDYGFDYATSSSANIYTFSSAISNSALGVGAYGFYVWDRRSNPIEFSFGFSTTSLTLTIYQNFGQTQEFDSGFIQFSTIPNCSSPYLWVQTHNQCQLCSIGYYYQNPFCQLCNASIPYCVDCTSSSNCSTCDYTLIFSGGSCIPNCTYDNCVSCSFTVAGGIECSSCASGYVINATNQTQCLPCASGTYYNSSLIECTSCSSMIQYCLDCSSGALCNTCNQTLIFSGGSCIPNCIYANCLSCNFSVAAGIACSSCAYGYEKNPSSQTQCLPCAVGTYFNSSTLACTSCSSIIQYCIGCSSSSVCSTCDYSLVFSGGSCIVNCIYSQCLSCSFSVATGIACSSCAIGYSVDPYNKTSCMTVCGDGLIVGSEQCDDSNALDGDGCSSACMVQQYFTCTNTSTTPSHCQMVVNISTFCLVKNEGSNSITVTFEIHPSSLALYKTLNWSSGFPPSSSLSCLEAIYDESDSRLRVSYAYNQSIQGLKNEITVSPSQIVSHFASLVNFNVTLPQNSQNNQVLEYFSETEYGFAKAVKFLAYAITALSFLLFCFGYLGSKLISLQFLAVVQLSGMLLLSLKNMKPAMAALQPLSLTLGLVPLSSGYIYQLSTLPPNLKLLFVERHLFKGQNIFLLFVVIPMIVGLILKLAEFKYEDKPFVKLGWKNSLGTFTFYGILMVAYGQFCYLATNIKNFSSDQSSATLAVSLLFAILTAIYIVGFLKLPRWFGSFKNKFLKFSITEYYYVFSTVERLITPLTIVFLSPLPFVGVIVCVIFASQAVFIAIKQPYLLKTWKRPLVNKILAAVICILTTWAAAFQSSSAVQIVVPIVIQVILLAMLTYSTYFAIKQYPSTIEQAKFKAQNVITTMELKQCHKKQIQDFAVKMLPKEYWIVEDIETQRNAIEQSKFKWYWENYSQLYSIGILESTKILNQKQNDKDHTQLKDMAKSKNLIEKSL